MQFHEVVSVRPRGARPRARSARHRHPRRAQRDREIGEARQVVHRQEAVDVRQHRADAGGARLEAVEAQQRIEPDDLVREEAQLLRGPASARRARRVSRPSVTSSTAALAPSRRRAQWRLKSSRQDAMRVPPFQSCTCAPASASATSGSRWRSAARDVGQARAEGQRVHLQVAPRQAVHVVQQQARVAVHRAGDVEQHDQGRQLAARLR